MVKSAWKQRLLPAQFTRTLLPALWVSTLASNVAGVLANANRCSFDSVFSSVAGLALGRDGGAIAQMIRPFWFGLGGPIADGRQWFPWIHVDDVAGIMIHAIENDHVTGILNATAPDYINNFEFTQAFAKQLRRPAVLPVPGFALNLVYGEERAKTLTSGQKVIPKRTVESGYEFLYPDIQSACREFGIMFHIDFQRNLKL